jgi:uncharacterized protein YjdB
MTGCHASYPSQPSTATPASFQVFYRNALGPQFVGASFAFDAYVLNSDGVYEAVTSKAAWTSSNSVVVSLTTTPSGFTALAPGLADVSATYQGFASTQSVTVYEADRQPFPFLFITPGDPHVVGQNAVASLSLRTTPTQTQAPTAAATWTSSDTRIVTADASSNTTARVTAVGLGTAQITATLNGVSGSYRLSIHP